MIARFRFRLLDARSPHDPDVRVYLDETHEIDLEDYAAGAPAGLAERHGLIAASLADAGIPTVMVVEDLDPDESSRVAPLLIRTLDRGAS